jgi:hypothetical protein
MINAIPLLTKHDTRRLAFGLKSTGNESFSPESQEKAPLQRLRARKTQLDFVTVSPLMIAEDALYKGIQNASTMPTAGVFHYPPDLAD